jgi:hypothetical protein
VRSVGGRFLNPSGGGIFFLGEAGEDTRLSKDPCHDHRTQSPVGPTVRELVRALRHQPVFTVSAPGPAAVEGATGVTVEVRIPPDVDADSCAENSVFFFSSGPDGWSWRQGYVARWWILKVPGIEDIPDTRVVVIEQCDVTCSDEAVETLTEMGNSMSFAHG